MDWWLSQENSTSCTVKRIGMAGFGILRGIAACILRPWEQIISYVYAQFHSSNLIRCSVGTNNLHDKLPHFVPN